MIYHSFTTSPEPTVIGVRDGLAQVTIRFDRFSDPTTGAEMERFFDFRTYWQRTDRTPPRPFQLEYAQLRPRAKQTDLLLFDGFYMGCPFLLSGRAREVFARHHLGPHHWFDVLLYDPTGAFVSGEYTLFYCPYLGYDAIDFARSRFRLNRGLPAAPRWQDLALPDQQAFEAFRDTTHKIPGVGSLVLSDRFDPGLDFFQCRVGPLFMSERLREAVEQAGLTNVVFPGETGSVAVVA
ncbi:imm11 family protein [Hymenobacter arizonensis]|uniref:Immunity MXAN-0049 protein domain-containing protein n=1 Tax=Hymenobacter arizonensis TaxID=1227077 RepID=A0A1I6BDQ7_HYMAR|nr:hypothetical protein SAMN04515668_4398 [Hymenobacter arizonensis]